MKVEKFFIFLILIAFLVSVGGVSAQDINNTSSDAVVGVDAVLTDTLYAEENNEDLESINTTTTNIEVLGDTSLDANFSCDVDVGIGSLIVNFKDNSAGNPTSWLWDFGDGYNSTLQNPAHTYNSIGYFNVSLKVSDGVSNSIVLKEDFIHVVYDRSVIVNPDFEDAGKPVGWDYSSVSVISYQKNAKNGKKYLTLNDNGYISQVVNLDTVDYISFWYMSENKGSKIQVLLDDESLFEYTIKNTGIGKDKWEQVLLNVSNCSGFHTLKIIQKGSKAYLDYFNLVHNDDIWVNFTLTDFTLVGDNLTLSFNDHSFGRIDGWLWDFGDGNTSTRQNVTHSFKTGHYTVSLKVFNKNTTKILYYEIPISFPTILRTGIEYCSIQEAIDNAQEGDIINIPNNIFYNSFAANIVVDKSLTLNFNNCTLLSDNVNPIILVKNDATVIVNNVSLGDNVVLKTSDSSKLTLTQSNIDKVILLTGNFEVKNNDFMDSVLVIEDACVNVNACNFSNSSIIVNGGKSRIFNNTFSDCEVAVTQTAGELTISSNIINNNNIGVNVSGGICNLSYNALYSNNISLLFNASNINYDNNWWGKNNPLYMFNNNGSCDICQLGDIEYSLDSWLVLNITQSDVLDYDYWTAGITYYNFTIDLNHNNLGEYIGDKFSLNNLNLNITSVGDIKERIHHFYYENHIQKLDVELVYNVVPVNMELINNSGNFIFTYGYLTSGLNYLTFNIFGLNYTVPVLNDTTAPIISYITPTCNFDDNLTVEILCEDSDAVIFYTLDGTNPAYSLTRLIYNGSLILNESSTLHYTVIDKFGNFQKYYVDSVTGHSFDIIEQDVFVELHSSLYNPYNKVPNIPGQVIYSELNTSTPIYYTFDGSNPAQDSGFNTIDPYNSAYGYNRETTGSNLLYTHPFVIHEPTEIRFVAQNRNDIFWVTPDYTTMTTYSLDNSINYLKNNNFTNDSDAIWSQYQGDNRNTGVTSYVGPVTNQSLWVNNAIMSSGSAAVDSNGRIVIGGNDGYLYYLNTQGLVIWRYGTTSKIICTPTIGSDGNIYFSNWMDSNVYCVSPDGELIWKYHLGDYNTGTSPVFGCDNQLYIITSNSTRSNLYVFKDGVLLSNNTIPLISGSTPAVASDGTLYIVGANQELVVVNWDGSLRYSKSLMRSNDYVDIQWDHISVCIDSNGTFYVLKGQYRTLHYPDYSSIDVVNAFYSNGTQKWVNSFDNYLVSGTPTYYNGVLYIVFNNRVTITPPTIQLTNGWLVALNASNGDILWMNNISGFANTFSSPLVSGDGVVYVASNNTVYAFNVSGEKLWQYTMLGKYGNPASYSSPTLTNDGVLIVTTNQGVYAFRDFAANFIYGHVNGTSSSIQFWDLSTEGSIRCFWDFGDGNYSFEQNPIHEYANGGKYRVILLVEYEGNVTLARNTTIEVVYHDLIAPSNVSAYINNIITMGDVYNETQIVSLNATDDYSDVIIYYTIDGSNPINSTTRRLYSEPLEIEVDTILNVVAVDSAGNVGNVSSFAFNITDALYLRGEINSSKFSEIQDLLDGLNNYTKVLFDFEVLEGVNFIIKKPVNIISVTNSKLICNSNQPVFTFTKESSGSTLNGFDIVNLGGDGILINNTSDILIRNCIVNVTNTTGINIINSENINVKGTTVTNACEGIIVNQSRNTNLNLLNIRNSYNNGVWIIESDNTVLSNSLLEYNGKDQYSSKANQVLIDDSMNTSILNNTIEYGFFGIHLYHTTDGVVIDKNIIREGSGDAILLSNTYSNVNITHNLIDGCFNGIDFMGYSENVTIKQNTIENLHKHDDDVYEVFDRLPSIFLKMMNYIYEVNVQDWDDYYMHCYNGIQISNPASNFDEGNTVIIDNVIIKLSHRAWEARKYRHYLNASCEGYGYNMMDGSDSYHNDTSGATHYREGKVDMVVDRIGDATFRLRLINRLDGHYLSEIPEFDVTFQAGGFIQTVKFVNDSAIASFDVASAVSDVLVIISTEIRKSAQFSMEITDGYNSTNKKNDSGYEAGEAINNPDPVVPSIDEYIEHNFPEIINNPEDNPEITPGTNPGNGAGNGTGHGNGTDGSGSGTGIGNGTGSGVGTGNGTSLNPGNTNSTGNATVSGNSTDVPTNSSDVSGNTPDIPANSTDVPANSTDVPVNNTEIPSNTTDVPANSTDVPVNSTEVPSNVTDVPVNSTDVPVNVTDNPVNSTDVPVNSTDVPANSTETPVNNTEIPSNTTDVPVNSTEVPSNVTDNPVNATDVPVNSTEIPSNSTDVPVNSTEVPSNVMDNPVNTTDVPTNSTAVDPSDIVNQNNETNTNNTDQTEDIVNPEDLQNPGDLNVPTHIDADSQDSNQETSQEPSPDITQETPMEPEQSPQESTQPGGEVGSAGGSAGSEGSKAYEIKKAIDIENTEISLLALVVFLSAVFFFIVGWRRGGSEDDDEL
jgi:PKD repeat protein